MAEGSSPFLCALHGNAERGSRCRTAGEKRTIRCNKGTGPHAIRGHDAGMDGTTVAHRISFPALLLQANMTHSWYEHPSASS